MMGHLGKTKYAFFHPTEIRPSGWLRRQLEIQAAGLAGNLDKVWPDVRDSAWIGGDREGWERVPYWLDGFIPLAYLLDDDDLKSRAKRYVDAIISRQRPDGWICPCADDARAGYDTWALLLISKVLVMYHDCTGDERVLDAVCRALKQYSGWLSAYPLAHWDRMRWYEGLIAIRYVYEIRHEDWLLALAKTLHDKGFDYEALIVDRNWETFKVPQHEWRREAHVVNNAMALKANPLYSLFDASADADFCKTMLKGLLRYHGMATGHFSGDECFAGTSPIQGTELCGVVEAMYSAEQNFAVVGDVFWLDYCERLAFNALPATCTPDMWGHQYDQQVNQIASVRENRPVWSTNGVCANMYGLEPNYGCCTANFGQGWPKFALSTFYRSGKGILSALLAPSSVSTRIGDSDVTVELATRYPFGGRLVYAVTVTRPVEFELSIRIPKWAKRARIDGRRVKTGAIASVTRIWRGTCQVVVELDFAAKLERRPSGMYALNRGPLLYSLPIDFESSRVEYTYDGVERKFPYCDYSLTPTSKWNYGFASKRFEVEEREIGDLPFAQAIPPIVIHAKMRELEWGLLDGCIGTCAERPESSASAAPVEDKLLVPYGCTMLRMTEMPVCE